MDLNISVELEARFSQKVDLVSYYKSFNEAQRESYHNFNDYDCEDTKPLDYISNYLYDEVEQSAPNGINREHGGAVFWDVQVNSYHFGGFNEEVLFEELCVEVPWLDSERYEEAKKNDPRRPYDVELPFD